jgi:hypothetical protein
MEGSFVIVPMLIRCIAASLSDATVQRFGAASGEILAYRG